MQKTHGQFTNGYDARGVRTHLSCDELNSIGTCVYSGDTDGLTYRQTFDFDRFGNMYRKAASNAAAGQANPLPFTPIEEATGPGTGDLDKAANRFRTETTYDDAGNVVGDGRIVRSYENRTVVQVYPAGSSTVEETEYYVRSSMLGGQVLTEMNNTGGKIKTNVYAGNGVIAEQIAASSSVVWRHTDVVTGSFDSYGTFPPNDPEFKAEFEPLGAILPEQDPNPDPQSAPMPNRQRAGGDFSNPEFGCMIDWFPRPCSELDAAIVAGVGNYGSTEQFRLIRNPRSGEIGWGQFFNYGNGMAGWWRDFPGPTSQDDDDDDDDDDVISIGTDSVHIPFNSDRNSVPLLDSNRATNHGNSFGVPLGGGSYFGKPYPSKPPKGTPCDKQEVALIELYKFLKTKFIQQRADKFGLWEEHQPQIRERQKQARDQIETFDNDDCKSGDPRIKELREMAHAKMPQPYERDLRMPVDSPILVPIPRFDPSAPPIRTPSPSFGVPLFCFSCGLIYQIVYGDNGTVAAE